MLKQRIAPDQALNELKKNPHATFRGGISRHWRVDTNGYVRSQDICWLFCWAKTGMGSPAAAKAAKEAFDSIFDLSFNEFDARVPHEWARWARYSNEDVDKQLNSFLGNLLADSIEIAYSTSQGIQITPESRKAIELHAMGLASKYYEAQGYQVLDHSRNRPYDLKCSGKDRTFFVEVKGTQTLGEQVLLTPGEVEFNRANRANMVLFVASQVVITQVADGVVASGGRVRILDPWDVDHKDGELWAVAYVHALPKG